MPLLDLIDLGKPRVTVLVLATTALGLWMAPGGLGLVPTLTVLAAVGGLVAAANTLNCWVERETDGLMRRTWNRPLPAGRLDPTVALIWGIALGLVAFVALYRAANPLTAWLGAAALVSYVCVYTPLKRLSPLALWVGAVPGAMPPLMGWTAATGELSPRGLALFAVLFVWQLPHFVAISLYLQEDYRRAGIRVLPVARGEIIARRHLFAYSVLLVPVSLAVLPLGMAGVAYLVTAVVLGAGFLFIGWSGLRSAVGKAWSRRAFAYSLIYLSVLISVLVLDAR